MIDGEPQLVPILAQLPLLASDSARTNAGVVIEHVHVRVSCDDLIREAGLPALERRLFLHHCMSRTGWHDSKAVTTSLFRSVFGFSGPYSASVERFCSKGGT